MLLFFLSPTHFTADAPSRDVGRRARAPAGRRRGPGNNSNDNRGPPRRQSLRLGTGKKGRGAELSRRRGSLRKRDRSAEKEARAVAAAERNTVQLPEYVWCMHDCRNYRHCTYLSHTTCFRLFAVDPCLWLLWLN